MLLLTFYTFLVCFVLQVGKDSMHFRPPEEQNQHKVTCGVNVKVLPSVLDDLERDLSRGRVTANIITSGTGEASLG
jgi:hypothetical protein